MKKIVILDGKTLGNINFEPLNEVGNVSFYETTKPEEVIERIKDANIIIVNKVVLNENNLIYATKLDIICETATGYNNIDLNYAKSRNIAVTNVAGYSTNTVAQHTFATVLSLIHKINFYDELVKSKKYSNSGLFTNLDKPFYELEGKTYGIIGFGAIGKRVAKLAEAFGAKVVYYSTSGKNSDSDYKRVEFEELLNICDVISIHAPLNENTKGLINYEALKKMKKTAIIANMGRGYIVVEEDLAKAIDEGLIAGAALDVFEVEPINENNPLLSIVKKDNLILTPHIAWAGVEARERLFNEVILNIKAYYNDEIRNRI